jgi:hypothetical protein
LVSYPKFIANFILNDLKGLVNKYGFKIDIVPPDVLKSIIDPLWFGEKTRIQVKEELDFYLWIIKRLSC